MLSGNACNRCMMPLNAVRRNRNVNLYTNKRFDATRAFSHSLAFLRQRITHNRNLLRSTGGRRLSPRGRLRWPSQSFDNAR
jgi:hypothetical protein